MKYIAPVMAALVLGLLLGGIFFSKTVYLEQPRLKLLDETEKHSMINVPAVDDNGKGVVTQITVKVESGSGKTLANVENIFFFMDTQNSIRVARDVAQEKTGFDLSDKDLIYEIEANASLIEGPSAGAAITLATIAAIDGKEIKKDVMMTGTINQDGTIGLVGGIPEKAKAAKELGAKLFLIPKGSRAAGQDYEYQRQVECRKFMGIDVCETKYVRTRSTSALGIEIREVANIEEAMNLILEEGVKTGGGNEV